MNTDEAVDAHGSLFYAGIKPSDREVLEVSSV